MSAVAIGPEPIPLVRDQAGRLMLAGTRISVDILVEDFKRGKTPELGLQRRVGDIDIVRVQDVGPRTGDDPVILQWATDENRVLVSHELRTLPDFAFQRAANGQPVPGVLVMRTSMPIAAAIAELAFRAEASEAEDRKDKVIYLPLR